MKQAICVSLAISLLAMTGCKKNTETPAAKSDNQAQQAAEHGGLFATVSFETAQEQAAESNKAIFIDFYTTWCGPCKVLEETILSDQKVIAYLKERTVPLKVDAEKQTALADRYRVAAYPTLVVVQPDGKELGRIEGAPAETEYFMNELEGILAGKSASDRAKGRLDSSDGGDPTARLEYAHRLLQTGDYDSALETLKGFYEEESDPDKANAALRVTTLPQLLGQLAQFHRPTGKFLNERRETVRSQIEEFDKDAPPAAGLLIAEYATLSRVLNDPDAPVEMFDAYRVEKPDAAVTDMLRDAVLTQLLEEKRFDDILAGIDPLSKTSEVIGRVESELAKYQNLPAAQKQQVFAQIHQGMINHVAGYYQALLGAGKTEQAAQVAEKLLAAVDSPAALNQLAWAGYLSGSPVEANLDQAQRAVEAAGVDNVAIVDTYARLLAKFDRLKEACGLINQADKETWDNQSRAYLEAMRNELGCAADE